MDSSLIGGVFHRNESLTLSLICLSVSLATAPSIHAITLFAQGIGLRDLSGEMKIL